MTVFDKMDKMGYELYKPNSEELAGANYAFVSYWKGKGSGISKRIVFNYVNKSCWGVVACGTLIGNKNDLEELNECYKSLEGDLIELRNSGIEINIAPCYNTYNKSGKD